MFLLAEIRKFTSEEYKQYKKSLENMGELDNIINSTEERAEMRGREAGRAEGRAEGSQEKALEIAKNLLEAGMGVEQISQMTGLSVDEVEAIALSQS